ncbi:MAG: tRNA 4-thiouridine(8) synthase ThiI [Oscillospiraceae bacterium]|nr:tRNA 4-thiouridine(8) synthase ThiI [Oscillospiraceae bacterium]
MSDKNTSAKIQTDIILLKQGEIVLKGLNRRSFEMKLVSNVNRRLKQYGNFHIYAVQSTVYVEPRDADCDISGAFEACRDIYGIVAVVRAAACRKDPDDIFNTAKVYLKDAIENAPSFKVESKRSDKSFPMTSIQLSQYVGGLLAEEFPDTPVDVRNPGFTVHLEIRDYSAYVHGPAVPGAGGMPVGSNGRVVSLLSGGIDSPVSTCMAAKRGLAIIPVHFFSFPYTSELAKEKVIELGHILTRRCGKMMLELVPFTHIQEEIRDNCPEELFTIITRRFMMKIADAIGRLNGCSGIITGECLGQVASQTMESMAVTQEGLELPVFRPLICLDKTEIIASARGIGTFDTSVLPYEDCCTIFTPKHPKTKPRLKDVLEAEKALDVQGLIDEALENIERIRL